MFKPHAAAQPLATDDAAVAMIAQANQIFIDHRHEDMAKLFSEVSAKDPSREAPLSRYAYGLVVYRRSLTARPDATIIKALKKADDLLAQEAGEELKWETMVLRAALKGMIAGGSSSADAMVYGPASDRLLEDVLYTNPQNPRALLIQGISEFKTPPLWGGSSSRALEHLKKSIQAFDKPPSQTKITWGKADAYLWLGMVSLSEKKFTQAQMAFQGALMVEPGFYAVKNTFLPQALKEIEGGKK